MWDTTLHLTLWISHKQAYIVLHYWSKRLSSTLLSLELEITPLPHEWKGLIWGSTDGQLMGDSLWVHPGSAVPHCWSVPLGSQYSLAAPLAAACFVSWTAVMVLKEANGQHCQMVRHNMQIRSVHCDTSRFAIQSCTRRSFKRLEYTWLGFDTCCFCVCGDLLTPIALHYYFNQTKTKQHHHGGNSERCIQRTGYTYAW